MGFGKGVLIFSAGAAVGGIAAFVTTKLVLQKKFNEKSQNDINAIHEMYREMKRDGGAPVISNDTIASVPTVFDSIDEKAMSDANKAESATTANAVTEIDINMIKKPAKKSRVKKPHKISKEEFSDEHISDEVEEYTAIGLRYYSDGVLCDDQDRKVANIDEILGDERYLDTFGDDPDDPDTIYIRNEAMKIDYEILLDSRHYTDILKEKPYLIKNDE